MEARQASACSEVDPPTRHVGHGAVEYLAAFADHQARFVDALADAGAGLATPSGHLGGVAAAQLRLTQQFLDAQRSILQVWAEADSAVAAISETAALEAAVFGLDVGGLIECVAPRGDDARSELRDLVERWWHAARTDSRALIESARANSALWVDVARLASDRGAADPMPYGERGANQEHGADDECRASCGGTVPDASIAEAGRCALPLDVLDALALIDTRSVHQVLDQLALALSDGEAPARASSVPALDTAERDHRPTPGDVRESNERFERFWTNPHAVEPARRPRSAARETIVPMLFVAVALVMALVAIG